MDDEGRLREALARLSKCELVVMRVEREPGAVEALSKLRRHWRRQATSQKPSLKIHLSPHSADRPQHSHSKSLHPRIGNRQKILVTRMPWMLPWPNAVCGLLDFLFSQLRRSLRVPALYVEVSGTTLMISCERQARV